MKVNMTLINRTESEFARVLLDNGSTICFVDPQEADQMLQVYFDLNVIGREAYYAAPYDKSWEHTEFNAQFHHV